MKKVLIDTKIEATKLDDFFNDTELSKAFEKNAREVPMDENDNPTQGYFEVKIVWHSEDL